MLTWKMNNPNLNLNIQLIDNVSEQMRALSVSFEAFHKAIVNAFHPFADSMIDLAARFTKRNKYDKALIIMGAMDLYGNYLEAGDVKRNHRAKNTKGKIKGARQTPRRIDKEAKTTSTNHVARRTSDVRNYRSNAHNGTYDGRRDRRNVTIANQKATRILSPQYVTVKDG